MTLQSNKFESSTYGSHLCLDSSTLPPLPNEDEKKLCIPPSTLVALYEAHFHFVVWRR